MIRFFNSKTRHKEPFVPVRPGKVGIYSCGPTVYNYFHIGNARPFTVFDVLRQYLEHKGYQVTFVQNFTDIDDKIIRGAQKEGITIRELSDKYIQAYYEDADALGIRRATVHPRATEHIQDIIDLISTLLEKGMAYAANGDVLFDTQAFSAYGNLSGQDLENLDLGSRIQVDEGKKHPMDFVLWKAQKPGEPFWDSPFGPGRPGWHIECSAMSMKYLGETLDIHTGGTDLLFPHHENETAQSEAATGKPFVNIWMHCGFININDEKMSKSLGNVLTIRELREKYDLEAVRFFLLSAHYRSPISFSNALIEQAASGLERLYNARNSWMFFLEHAQDKPVSIEETDFLQRMKALEADFEAAMDDDLNTAEAIGTLFEMVKAGNSALSADSGRETLQKALDTLNQYARILGVLSKKADALDADIQALVDARQQARAEKNWAESDRLRDLLKEKGYSVEDTKQGQKVTLLA